MLTPSQKSDARTVLLFLRTLAEAEDVRYTAAPRPMTDDELHRVSSRPSDPTGRVALDGPRLALSAQIARSERALARIAHALRPELVHLDAALAAWADGRELDEEAGR